MNQDVSDQDLQAAMDGCASEQVHIPGLVQPFGCLIGVNSESGHIDYASENCADVIGMKASDLLGTRLQDACGHEIAHALNNAASRSRFSEKSAPMGQFRLGGLEVETYAFASEGTQVLQFERAKDPGLGGGDALSTLSFLMSEIQNCPNQTSLFNLTTDLLRHLTGFDRVMIYKFDAQFNGEVVAETRQRAMEPYLGLRFPKWDIPAQARAIMAKIPLRLIEDVDREPSKLRAANPSLGPLDITLAECRGVSPVHNEYLRNMGTKATMTLSVVVEGALWGIISFHHRRARVPAPKLRELLTTFQEIFATKLSALLKQSTLELVRRTDGIKDSVLDEIEGEETLEGSINRIGRVIEDVLQADGVALLIGSKTVSYGRIPEQAVLEHLLNETQTQFGTTIISDNLKQRYPQFADQLNGCAGVLASTNTPHRALCIFRSEASQVISWAGNPEKKIEVVSGKARLAPRESFSQYLQDIDGHSPAWSEADIYFAERVWVLVNSAESRALKNTLNRQQTLMINELNHRVRNILALVRSVSRQARRHYGSLESYSASLESRVQALAAAHDIASGSDTASVDLKQLVAVEMAPYGEEGLIQISGPSRFLRADIAPIFSLVVHELATNAAKYGALSSHGGSVAVTTTDMPGGVSISWREQGGPQVAAPDKRGFGSTLIEQAVPHEMGGTADLRFVQTGVEADFFLPNRILDNSFTTRPGLATDQNASRADVAEVPFDPEAFDGFVLLLEDNFIIAKDMKDQLGDSGVDNVEIFSSVVDAMEVLAMERPVFAILDVNLGPGKTSEPVARHLQNEGVPFIFVTGYGDRAELSSDLQNVPRFTKPLANTELQNAMMALMTGQSR